LAKRAIRSRPTCKRWPTGAECRPAQKLAFNLRVRRRMRPIWPAAKPPSRQAAESLADTERAAGRLADRANADAVSKGKVQG